MMMCFHRTDGRIGILIRAADPKTSLAGAGQVSAVSVPKELVGKALVSSHARLDESGKDGDVSVRATLEKAGGGEEALTGVVWIQSGAIGSTATAGGEKGSTLADGDVIRVYLDATSKTPPKGLAVQLEFG